MDTHILYVIAKLGEALQRAEMEVADLQAQRGRLTTAYAELEQKLATLAQGDDIND